MSQHSLPTRSNSAKQQTCSARTRAHTHSAGCLQPFIDVFAPHDVQIGHRPNMLHLTAADHFPQRDESERRTGHLPSQTTSLFFPVHCMAGICHGLEPANSGTMVFAMVLEAANSGTIVFAMLLETANSGTIVFATLLEPANSGTMVFAMVLEPATEASCDGFGNSEFGDHGGICDAFGTSEFGDHGVCDAFGSSEFGDYVICDAFGTSELGDHGICDGFGNSEFGDHGICDGLETANWGPWYLRCFWKQRIRGPWYLPCVWNQRIRGAWRGICDGFMETANSGTMVFAMRCFQTPRASAAYHVCTTKSRLSSHGSSACPRRITFCTTKVDCPATEAPGVPGVFFVCTTEAPCVRGVLHFATISRLFSHGSSGCPRRTVRLYYKSRLSSHGSSACPRRTTFVLQKSTFQPRQLRVSPAYYICTTKVDFPAAEAPRVRAVLRLCYKSRLSRHGRSGCPRRTTFVLPYVDFPATEAPGVPVYYICTRKVDFLATEVPGVLRLCYKRRQKRKNTTVLAPRRYVCV